MIAVGWDGMEIAFQSKDLRELCQRELKAISIYGEDVAASFRRRLADIRAAENIFDLVATDVYEIPRSAGKMCGVDLCNNFRIVLKANDLDIPQLSSGRPDWKNISRVKLMRIEDISG